MDREGVSRERASLARVSEPEEVEIPEDYIYPYILVACAWTPWGHNTPSEWKYLMSSSGPKKRKKPDAGITLDTTNPSPAPPRWAG